MTDAADHPLGRSAGNAFAAPALMRAAHRRRDDAWLAARREDPAAQFLPLAGQDAWITGGDEPSLLWLPGPQLAPLRRHAREVADGNPEPLEVLLAEDVDPASPDSGAFALLLPAGDDGAEALLRQRHPDCRRAGLRELAAILDARQAALLATARAFAHWHGRHRYCGTCGGATVSAEAGHLRRCTRETCGQEHFPRTDPAVIMLVEKDGRALLGRQASWPAGMVSTLAGFVEPGEALEAAVAREVWEETGVELARVRYHSSQPWPFPGSLMVGFTATAATTTITLDSEELEDARWFSRQEIANGQAAGTLRLPSPYSIARRLVEDWLVGGREA